MPSNNKFHVIIPTHSAHDTLSCAVQSALSQSLPPYRVTIIGDGVSEEVRREAKGLAQKVAEVEFLDYPKLKNRGERYRDQVIRTSEADFISYLCDDDLLLPNHLETMAEYLELYDFVHPRPTFFNPNGDITFLPSAIEIPRIRSWHSLHPPQNSISLTGASHTRDAYLNLPNGWSAGPEQVWTDLFMWTKFFDDPKLKAFTVPHTTTIKILYTQTQRDTFKRTPIIRPWLVNMSDSTRLKELQSRIETVYKENVFDNSLRVSSFAKTLDRLLRLKRIARKAKRMLSFKD